MKGTAISFSEGDSRLSLAPGPPSPHSRTSMKICDVTQFYSSVGGGVKRYITEKRRHILEQTGDSHVLVIPGEKTAVVREGRLTTCTIASPPVNRTSRYRILVNLRVAREMILAEAPDVIESGDPYHVAWSAIRLGEENRIPVVGFYHSHFPEAYLRTLLKYFGPWVRDAGMAWAQDYIVRLYNSFDLTLVPSSYLAGLLGEWGVMNTRHVHLGMDAELFQPGPADPGVRARLGIRPDAFLLLYVGRLAGEKNTRTLLKAFEHLEQTEPGRHAYLVVGDGQLRGLVEDLARRVPSLKWVRHVSDSQELAGLYRAADLFVHPGVCETFGLVSLESQACGCPVAGIRGSYMDANIMSGIDLWGGENQPEALAGTIRRFRDHQDLKALGLEASAAVRSRYAWPVVFARLWEAYREAIALKKGHP